MNATHLKQQKKMDLKLVMKILRVKLVVFPMTGYSKMWDGIYDEFKVIKQRDAQKLKMASI